MARQNPVPQREKEICRRLRDFREATRLSQVAFAQELQIGNTKLGNYECGRVPIRYGLAKQIADKFGLSIAWLAEGVGDMTPTDPIHPELEKKIGPRTLLSQAYDEFLARLGSRAKTLSAARSVGMTVHRVRLGTPIREVHEELLYSGLRDAIKEVPFHLRGEFVRTIARAVTEFGRKHGVKTGRRIGMFLSPPSGR